MTDFQAEKQIVRAFYQALDNADSQRMPEVMSDHCADDLLWRGFHPFGEIRGAARVGTEFWQPLHYGLTRLQRRMDVFMAGHNMFDETRGVWVCSMGHLMGLFDRPWLNIRPTGKMAFLRYCAFHKVAGGRIVETAMYFDIPHLMMQAGLDPFPPQTAAHLVQPGPLTHDGLMFDAQPAEAGRKTLALINAMVAVLGQWDSRMPLEQELAQTWADDMLWWGPAGIGATYTIDRYAKQHSAVFRAGFGERSRTRHICRLAEGHFGGFFGWPNFSATPTGGFMGMPATGKPGDFRVIDIYRRQEGKLAENWVFIDLLHFWDQQGVDILARTTGIDEACVYP
ncbi:nuclear transport factor 2 family protein [Sedimentitalea todarodis]|uniref:Nuclear transport factor 2 family protein n=1 Tax=Sedimentitalea todarodis TaxID=1631240 RepID=A0ABU3VE09_9RHOB|nr:nuclear transport factor 2 family protein [Sedimentitalea todarodis]MDU9004415.1 nuclear transport factor 2 family protein [Sedimentitalea todarodis]